MVRLVALCALVVMGEAPAIHAQTTNAIRGVVKDGADNRPLGDAVVEIAGNGTTRQTTRTTKSGEFEFSHLPQGSYRLTTRRLGYAVFDTLLAAGDGRVEIRLRRVATSLPAVNINGGPGLWGTVGVASNLRPLTDARVEVVGLGRPVLTDSAGRYALPLEKHGKVLVRVSHSGFVDYTRWVDAPDDHYAELSVLVDSGRTSPENDALWAEFGERSTWGRLSSAVVPGEELQRYGDQPLTDALRRAPTFVRKGLRLDASTCVFVNGRPMPGWPLNAFAVADIEAVELYGKNADPTHTLERAWPETKGCGKDAVTSREQLHDVKSIAEFAVVWLKPKP